MRSKPAVVVVAACIVTGLLGLAAVRGLAAPPEELQGLPPLVQVTAVTFQEGTREIRATGVTRASRRAELSFTIGGRMGERMVETGSLVEAGDPLAQIDPGPLRNAARAARASVGQVRAQLGQARRDRRRARALSMEHAVSAARLDAARATVRALGAHRAAARAEADEAVRMLEEGTLRAPFSGIVSAVLLEPGEFTAPGRPVIVLSGRDTVEVEFDIAESRIHAIDVGARVRVNLPLAGREGLVGTVRSVGRSATSSAQQFPVVVQLPSDDRTLPGMTAEVVFDVGEAAMLTVPLRAVFNPGGQHPSVYIVRDGLARRVELEAGNPSGDWIAVTGDLLAGEFVVVAGHAALIDGEEVRSEQAQRLTDGPTS